MRRLSMFLLVTAIGTQAASSSSATDQRDKISLAEMSCVRLLAEELHDGAKRAGIRLDGLKRTMFVEAKAKLPRLEIIDNQLACSNGLIVSLTMLETEYGGFAAFSELQLFRQTTIEESRKKVGAEVWSKGSLIKGPMKTAKSQIFDVLEEHMSAFAAAYYKAGND